MHSGESGWKIKHDKFIGQVQNRARLGLAGHAELAMRNTLKRLAKQLAASELFNAAAQLLRGIGEYLPHSSDKTFLSPYLKSLLCFPYLPQAINILN
ncbi:MAG: hypothetical protein RMX96_18180 [Nostoc sp. ChiSLP02]|nr:hypothetical protein [Nostoc sp. DedSLP05]MDZ8097628.1 hypothetical protein [Nostoc sp. DedSLP01]MDZ8186765.1 hypothetical protein [Nostoc sp. ChiSLP02]